MTCTHPTIPAAPHEDDLRLALHEARVGVMLIEVAVELQAHGQPNAAEVTSWRDRFLSSLSQVFGYAECPATPPKCRWCRDGGRIGNDIACPKCEAGAVYDAPIEEKEVPRAAESRRSIVP